MAITVHRIINKPIPSNCFVIYDKAVGNECLIVDTGSKSDDELLGFISAEQLVPKYIILTHEHFDHCWGVNELVAVYGVPVICSALCAEKIGDIKKNCSVFYDIHQSFEVHCDAISIESLGSVMDFDGHLIKFYNTPGHTDASISFVIDKYLFTGDTLMYGVKTPTKLPTGSLAKLKESMELYKSLSKGYLVMSGHGEVVVLDRYEFV